MNMTGVLPSSGSVCMLRVHSSGHRSAGALRVRASTSNNKGFGSKPNESGVSQKKMKVSSRGKVATRPGMQSAKEVKKQEEQAREARENAEAAAKAERIEQQQAARSGVPEVVSNRMIQRIVTFAGLPLVSGFLVFPLFYYLKVLHDPPIDIPGWAAGLASALTFGGAAVGISYGVLSASWDPSRSGSALGIDEFKQNVPIFMKRFGLGGD
mmetsp:Transcript_50641/g.94336  ORF Transcript_50641/g.94336 Transcript_50641/m.94336 type:complete len:211 (-) Transcript_50641:121-753(-)